jgi:uncharacterized membrane protein
MNQAKIAMPPLNRPNPREVALTAIMTAATAAVTMVISIPFPPTRGYFNLGDAMVMLAGLLFGARLGGVAGGIGSALSDVLLGYGYFAPLTLFIKGTEGFLTGLVGNSRRFPLKVAGVIAGAVAMLVGYFSVETPLYGFGAAFAELVAINSIQVLSGAIISLTLAQIIFRTYPDVKFLQQKPERARTGMLMVVVAAVVLSAVVGLYLVTGVSP